jgi:fructosamine-3-kinase
MSIWQTIEQKIQSVTGQPFEIRDRQSVGGGSINQAYRIGDGQQVYFVKLNQASKLNMFAAEALGLQAITDTLSIRVPQVLGWGSTTTHSFMILEWINLGRGEPSNWSVMGKHLANLHRHTHAQGFGWIQANTIGETPQINTWCTDWATFFSNHRIGYQLKLAQRSGGAFSQAQALLRAIPQLLTNHSPQPSLVHGDLWSGNAAFSNTGEPIIFDPAVYYGDREVDLAMTELFGGFPPSFYQGYRDTWPLAEGYSQRKVLYNLYHILNHFNLFGGSYFNQAERMMNQVIKMVN